MDCITSLGYVSSWWWWWKVRAILVDPSCSGSGITSLERQIEADNKKRKKRGREQQGRGDDREGEESRRLVALSRFQYTAVIKAMSFPQVFAALV